MQTTLRQRLEQFSHLNQTQLFEFLQQQAGVLSDKMRLLVSSLGMLSLSRLLPPTRGWKGRPAEDRQALATAFLAKAILGLQTTRQLLDRLQVDRTLRSLCGWNSAGAVPHESTFSRAFAEFSQSELPQQLHQVLIQNTYQKRHATRPTGRPHHARLHRHRSTRALSRANGTACGAAKETRAQKANQDQ